MVYLKEGKNMKKILIVNDLLYGGGTENVLTILMNTLKEAGHSITVLTYYHQEGYQKFQLEGVRYIHLGCPIPKFEANERVKLLAFKVRNLYSKFMFYYKNLFVKYDVVIAFKEGYMTQLTSRLRAPQKIAWVHTDFESFHWSKTSYKSEDDEKKCYALYTTIVTVSMKSKEAFHKTIGYRDKVKMIYNPLDFETIISRAEKEVINFKKPLDKKLFITVGRLSEVKGYNQLLEIVNELNRYYEPYFELWIIGDGEIKEILQDYISANDLNNVKLLGHQDNPYPYLKQADYFICSSKSESFGIAIVESMILNLPVISTKCGIVEEIITDETLGMILNDINSLSTVMKEILENKSIKIDHTKVMEKCYQNFSIETFNEQVQKLIGE